MRQNMLIYYMPGIYAWSKSFDYDYISYNNCVRVFHYSKMTYAETETD